MPETIVSHDGGSPASTTQNSYFWACSECLTAACWLAKHMCQKAQNADIIILKREDGVWLNRENHEYFDDFQVRASRKDYERFTERRQKALRKARIAGAAAYSIDSPPFDSPVLAGGGE